jgi:hypothetical protein
MPSVSQRRRSSGSALLLASAGTIAPLAGVRGPVGTAGDGVWNRGRDHGRKSSLPGVSEARPVPNRMQLMVVTSSAGVPVNPLRAPPRGREPGEGDRGAWSTRRDHAGDR